MKRLSTGLTILNAALALTFLLFALVQLNDPDPAIWFSIYLLTAVFCAVSIFRMIPPVLLFGFGLVVLFYASMHLEYAIEWIFSEDKSELFGEMREDKYYLEGTREFLGLLIALAAILFLIKQQKVPRSEL